VSMRFPSFRECGSTREMSEPSGLDGKLVFLGPLMLHPARECVKMRRLSPDL
jgi:hypothetical protein